MDNNFKKSFITILITSIVISALVGGMTGFWAGTIATGDFDMIDFLANNTVSTKLDSGSKEKITKIEEESAIISAVEKVNPAVVSIIVTKDLPILERYYIDSPESDFFRRFFGDDLDEFFGFGDLRYRQKGTERREVGGGTGFFISADGYIVTNKHVVVDQEADYTVLMNDESRYEAEVLARDQINDLAILKITGNNYPYVELGDSSGLKVGQSVIAIGNALGEFRNTVSTGVISGLARSIIASGAGFGTEELFGVIQTDASINPGNSGGPLLNIAGQAIGINTAIAQGAENIGFAIPANEIRNIYESVKKYGKIVRPWLGVRYLLINKTIVFSDNGGNIFQISIH